MSTLLQMSADGKRFHGRWNESLRHCITQSEFHDELRRINAETLRHTGRRSTAANLAYALPFICIPFGILLIVLSTQAEKWPFVVAGVVLSAAGVIGGALFRSVLGLVLVLCGIVLAIIPYADKTSWACIVIGTLLAILGSVGLMALALRHNPTLRSARILVVLLPIAIVFFCVPAQNLEYPAVMICIGVVLIVAGVLGALETAVRPSRQRARCLQDLRLVVDQMNQRYAGRLVWTLIEQDALEIVVEVDERAPYGDGRDPIQPAANDPQRNTQPQAPVVNVIVQQSRQQQQGAEVAVSIPERD